MGWDDDLLPMPINCFAKNPTMETSFTREELGSILKLVRLLNISVAHEYYIGD